MLIPLVVTIYIDVMPNHITNRLTVIGSNSQAKRVFESLKSENTLFDFNKIVPMPKELEISSSSDGDAGMKYILYKEDSLKYPTYENIYKMMEGYSEERKQSCIRLGQKYLDNLKKYQFATWYDWRIEYWGTKWNAYDIEMIDDYTIQFNTAWSGVPDLIRQLSLLHPEVEFEYVFADEDVSYNTGVGIMKNGESEMNYPDGGSIEAFQLYFITHEYARDSFEFVNNEWKWKEE